MVYERRGHPTWGEVEEYRAEVAVAAEVAAAAAAEAEAAEAEALAIQHRDIPDISSRRKRATLCIRLLGAAALGAAVVAVLAQFMYATFT
jgi:hypothetical protein